MIENLLIFYTMSHIHRPIPRKPASNNLGDLDTTQHGDTTSTSTRNRRPVESRERRTPVYVSTGTKNPSSNTETAKWSLMTKKKAGGKRKKRKTQKKRKSTKKRNNKKK